MSTRGFTYRSAVVASISSFWNNGKSTSQQQDWEGAQATNPYPNIQKVLSSVCALIEVLDIPRLVLVGQMKEL